LGSKTEVSGHARHVRFTLRSRHRQPAPACPFDAIAAFCTARNKRALFEKPRWCPRQIDTISMAGMLIGDTNLSLVAVSSPRSNQPSAHVVARFHPLAQPPEAIRASRTRKSSRWRLAPQTDCDSFSGPSSLKKAAKHVAYFASPLSSDANGATLRVEGSLTTIIS